ncbi:uncharacterized protein LOC112882227 isoform X1 [Panicum hallii]|uniref:uncharacterized protein LOC112882227 isoform X1 n=1 Tax=Panicum hallii TaxID=206008 RepID=UPI000DF4E7C5|nr:uncharacterized protein LOC112882227 isoform X1 [Panicum hallii]
MRRAVGEQIWKRGGGARSAGRAGAADAARSAAALRSRAAGGRLGPAHGEKEVPAGVLHPLLRGRRRKQPSGVPGARRIWRTAAVRPSGPAEGKARVTLGRHLQREGAAAKGDERGGGQHALDGGSSPDPPTSRLPRSGAGGEGSFVHLTQG